MDNRVDIIIKNKKDIKGPLTINLHLVNDQTPVEVNVDGKTSSLSPENSYEFKAYGRIIVLTVIVIVLAITVIGGIFVTSNFTKQKVDEKVNDSKEVPRIVSRDGWLARPSIESMENLKLPVEKVIIAHTATLNCSNQASCISRIQIIQNFHMDVRGSNDIVYNFMVGGDGIVYEGRGWNTQGAHTFGFNANSICIAFIGTFSNIQPPEKQLNAAKWIIDEGVRLNKLIKDYRLYGARQLMGTESPGSALYEIIKQWPNWSNAIST